MILVVGAGIAGLSTAHALLARGAQVTVVEAGKIACGASGVATSYLEPRLGTTPMRKVEWEALRRWPEFVAALEQDSGISVQFRTEGQIRVAISDNLARFEKDQTTRCNDGWRVEPLKQDDLNRLEPALSKEIAAGCFLPDIRWVNGQKVCEALARIIVQADGEIIQETALSEIGQDGKNCRATLSDGRAIDCDAILLCTGTGSHPINGLPADIGPCRAVRGVNLNLDMTALQKPLRHMIKHHRGNLCPRGDRHLIVGTTYEPGETSLDPSSDVIERLLANAEPILPTVRQLPLLGVTAGLRAKIGDGNLRLGRSSENPQIYYSLSHAGAGYLRAPVVAEEMARFMVDGNFGALMGLAVK